jgi:hypothetical protein
MQIRDEPGRIAAIVFGLVLIVGFLFMMIFGWTTDPWNDQGRGPGWECDRLGKGAVVCGHDVPKAWQKPRKSN